ncbi:MAG: GGDEF domain-containing protein [Deltaproteobacteria bacterium]|nr:GGDEF domain-containing protein [Deltaproteobacteria bacterium]
MSTGHATLVLEANWRTGRKVMPVAGTVVIGGPDDDLDLGGTAPLAIATFRDDRWWLRACAPNVTVDDRVVEGEVELRHGQRIADPESRHRLWFLIGDEQLALDELRHVETVTDPMTSLFTRRVALRHLDRMRDGALLMIDVDRLKQINDRYGMQAGELTLRRVSRILRDHVAWPNLAARYGGEEFLVMMPGVDLETARAVAERLRVVAEPPFSFEDEMVTATISIGVALHDPAGATIHLADEALMQAKVQGRNRVRCR